MRRITVDIAGMSCGHCLQAVNDALVTQPGIQMESLRMGRAVVSYDEQVTSPSAIEGIIAEAGYTATALPNGER
ncbi:MAG TPA: cation transporter [Gemmatimonadales bacterium]|nr:cation transporter [Gemmatimonadales bacterium]